jgi:hypothetical protein
MSYLNADPSLKERYILTAIFFLHKRRELHGLPNITMVILYTDTYSERHGFERRMQMGDITQDLRSFHKYSFFLHNGEISP